MPVSRQHNKVFHKPLGSLTYKIAFTNNNCRLFQKKGNIFLADDITNPPVDSLLLHKFLCAHYAFFTPNLQEIKA